jgi:hypothetical protein
MIPDVILDQIDAWHEEGHSNQDILSQLLWQNPSLTAEQIEKLHLILDLPYQPQAASSDVLSQLVALQQQRQQLLASIEPKLQGETVPVSLFNLYRGVLRDQEASLWKMMQHQQPPVKQTTPARKHIPLERLDIIEPPIQQPARKRSGFCSFLSLFLLFILGCITACCARYLPLNRLTSTAPCLTLAASPTLPKAASDDDSAYAVSIGARTSRRPQSTGSGGWLHCCGSGERVLRQ